MVMLRWPQQPRARNRLSQTLVDGLSKQFDIGIREVPCIPDLFVQKLFRRIIVRKRRLDPTGQQWNPVAFLAHGREQGIQSRHAP